MKVKVSRIFSHKLLKFDMKSVLIPFIHTLSFGLKLVSNNKTTVSILLIKIFAIINIIILQMDYQVNYHFL